MQSTTTALLIAILSCVIPMAAHGGTDSTHGPDTEPHSCGVRCSYFIAALYNKAADPLDTIAERIQQSSDGTSTFLGMSKWFQSLGLTPSGRRMQFGELVHTPYPVIVQVHSDCGDHFLVWGGVREDVVRLFDPPASIEISETQFTDKWSGLALVVQPPVQPPAQPPAQPPVTVIADNGSPLTCDTPSLDLGRFTLPLLEKPAAKFVVRNVATHPIEIHSLVTSCGCAAATYDKQKLLPGEKATISCEVTNPANQVGLQRYTLAVRIRDENYKPLMLKFTAYYERLVTIRPLRLYFGSIRRAELPKRKTLELVSREDTKADTSVSASASAPWIHCTVDDAGTIVVSLVSGVPMGAFTESVEVKTRQGAINIPVTGECVGSIRAVPRLVVLLPKREATFTVVSMTHTQKRKDAYILNYNKEDLTIRPVMATDGNGDTCQYTVAVNKKTDAAGPYYVDIIDPGTHDKTSVCVWPKE